MPNPIRIAVVQFSPALHPTPSHVSRNLARLESFVSDASVQNADIVVFPEFYITGALSDETLHLADEESAQLGHAKKLARKYGVDLVSGTFVERSPQDRTQIYNTAYYISRDGEILGSYQKKNLWHPERAWCAPGTDPHSVFSTRFGFRASLLACWDLAFPESFRPLVAQEVDIVFAPTFWLGTDGGDAASRWNADAETVFLDSLCVTRAFENECVVVMANAGGSAEEGFIGRSAVTAPLVGEVLKFRESEERMEVVEVDLDVLEDARKQYKIREDMSNGYGTFSAPQPPFETRED